MIPDNFIKSVPEDDLPGFLRTLLSATQTFEKDLGHLVNDAEKAHIYCKEALVMIEIMNRIGNLGIDLPELNGDRDSDIEAIRTLVKKLKQKAINAIEIFGTEDDREEVSRDKEDHAVYEFTDNDHERVQQLINELRQIVSKSSSLGDDHQLRLLKRLEKLQLELHKYINNFDRFWGLFGDAGEAIGKFGEDTKPFTDRIRELFEIIRRTQSQGNKSIEGSETDKLPNKECSEDSDIE